MRVTWLRNPHKLRFVFLAVMLLLALALCWLGWRLLAQEKELAAQHMAEQRDTAADLAVSLLDKKLNGIEQDLDHLLAGDANLRIPRIADEEIFVRLSPGNVQVWPQHSLPYYPGIAPADEAPGELFASADRLEFADNNSLKAIEILKGMLASRDSRIRSAALVRLARNDLKAGNAEESLRVFSRLGELGDEQVAGLPAALAARAGAMSVFEQHGDRASIATAALDLERELGSGRWHVSYAGYEYLRNEVQRAGGQSAPEAVSRRVGLAEGTEWLSEKMEGSTSSNVYRENVAVQSGRILVVRKTDHNTIAAYVATAAFVEQQLLANVKTALEARNAVLALSDAEGPVAGHIPAQAPVTIRLASTTGLPWTLQVANTGSDNGLRSRRNLLAAGMSILLALIFIGAWFIGHAVAQELAVASLQSDFVSTVSHEFRTPLTMLCQLSELLHRGRVASDEHRRQYYELLHNESHRLRRLVESLLNFGRLEAGKMQFRFEPVVASALVQQTAAEFTANQEARGHHFEIGTLDGSLVVNADRETLHCVLWNLFENAVKYSPDSKTVWVTLASSGPHAEIAILDRGVGIPVNEQRKIFEKFVRGATARDRGIRGTGIGLAMAREIVRAHGGDITVESEPGKGSTFRVLLPLAT